ncbi:hypothetical protein [Enteroscipio rubneri]|uniref:hypothetical protein n=1 Tax=Enteroscipio rubneri TaxID=2070686 RepID=UPI0012FFFAD9|nr:hypothetical protein [Enteroscipio rubneri]
MAARCSFGANAEETPKEAPGHAASPGKHEAASRTPSTGPKPSPKSTTPKRAQKAARARSRALTWIAENPDAWHYMEGLALHEVEAERPFSVKWVAEQARRKDFAGKHGKPSEFSNTLTAAFARILIEEHPEVRPFVVLKPSMFDEAL